MMFKRILFLGLIAMLVMVPAVSAKRTPGGASKPTLFVAPAAPVVGDTLVFTGCNWEPNELVVLVLSKPSAPAQTFIIHVVPGSDGCFSTTTSAYQYVAQEANSYTADASQSPPFHNHATLEYTVS